MDERTLEIIKLFKTSWTETEERYDDLINNHPGFNGLKPLRQYISKLKEAGGYNHFRLGTSMHTLVISRSVNHGLRIGQKHIKIEALTDNEFFVLFCDGQKTFKDFCINDFDDPRLTRLLKTLESNMVD